ncbi:MAG: DUF998 domain-containing protein [Methylococcaceae bacterium]|nr:DUF998 domain-containing protein [Methylococcaceae bacterium]
MKTFNYKGLVILLSALAFISIVTALPFIQSDYSSTEQLMSELALGGYGFLMLFAFLAFAIAVFTAQQILATYDNNLALRTLLIIASCSLAGAGVFELGDYDALHIGLVALAFVLIVLAMYLVPRLIPVFQAPTPTIVCWSLGVATAIFVALGQDFIPMGIAQRLAAGCLFIWLLWLAAFHQKQMASH